MTANRMLDGTTLAKSCVTQRAFAGLYRNGRRVGEPSMQRVRRQRKGVTWGVNRQKPGGKVSVCDCVLIAQVVALLTEANGTLVIKKDILRNRPANPNRWRRQG